MSGSREQLRAVFLAFVMVTSVMVASVAFTGSAAADVGSDDISGVSVTAVEADQTDVTADITFTGVNDDGSGETLEIDSGDLPTGVSFTGAEVTSSGFTGTTTAQINGGDLEVSIPAKDENKDVSVDVTYSTGATGSSTLNVDTINGVQTDKASDTLNVNDNAVSISSAVTGDSNDDGAVDSATVTFSEEIDPTSGATVIDTDQLTLNTDSQGSDTGDVTGVSGADDGDETITLDISPSTSAPNTGLKTTLDTTGGNNNVFADKSDNDGDLNPSADSLDQNVNDGAEPVLVSATAGSSTDVAGGSNDEGAAQNALLLDFSESIDSTDGGTDLEANDFTVKVNGTKIADSRVSEIDGTPDDAETLLELDDTDGSNPNPLARIEPSDTVTVAIDNSDGGIVDTNGNTRTSQSAVTASNEVLDVSASLSTDSIRGETPTITVSVDKANGNAYESNAEVGIYGLTNSDADDEAVAPNDALDSDADDPDYTLLASGETGSGTYTTTQTMNGQEDGTLIDEYFVAVRKGTEAFTDSGGTDDAFSGNGELQGVDGSATFSGAPDVTVDTTSVTRGESATVSGSLKRINSQGDRVGVDGYSVSAYNVEASSTIGSAATTASNGDFATTKTLYDAATHAVSTTLYNTSYNIKDTNTFGSFEVTANNQPTKISSGPSEITAKIKQSQTITAQATGATGNTQNVTRFKLSGVDLSKINLPGDAQIGKVTFTDGTTVGDTDPSTSLDIWTADLAAGATAQDPDGDNTDEIKGTPTPDGQDIETNSEVNIQSIVLLAEGTTNPSDNDAQFKITPAETGTLTVESQVEDYTTAPDTSDTPKSPDYTGTTEITVTSPQDVNVGLAPSESDLTGGDSTTIAPQDVAIDIVDNNGLGLQHNPNDGEIQKVTVTITGNGTQFEAETSDNDGSVDTGETADDSDVTLENGGGQNLDKTKFVAEDDDIGGSNSPTFTVDNIAGEQNGTLTVDVTADVKGQSTDITGSATYTFQSTNKVANLTPTSGTQIKFEETTTLSAEITDGSGTALNNRILQLSDGSISSGDDIFEIDTDDDGEIEEKNVDAIRVDGATGEIQYYKSGAFSDSTETVTVNNGYYEADGIVAAKSGVDLEVKVLDNDGSDMKAYFPKQASTTGQDTYDISSDPQTLVAGFQDQVNLTITNTSSGQQLNGSDLNNLLDNDDGSGVGAEDDITQSNSELVADIGSSDTVDLDDDGTDETVQVDVTPTGTQTINVTVDNGDSTKVGDSTIDVVAPEVETNLTGVFTERLEHNIEITAVDPRDGSNLYDSDTTPNLAISAYNGTVELAQIDNAQTDISEVDAGETLINAQGSGSHLADISEGNQSVTVLPYRDGVTSGPFNVSVAVSTDTNNGGGTTGDAIEDYYGETNFTVQPQQIDVSPETVNVGEQSTVQIVAEDANNDALSSRRIDLSGAGVTVRDVETDSSGFVATQVNPAATGNITVYTASDGGADNSISADTSQGSIVAQQDGAGGPDAAANTASDPPEQGAAENNINVVTEQSDFDVSVSTQTVTANQTSTVTVTATNNASGDAVEGASVELSGAGVDTSKQTDANGEASFDVTASQSGTIDVTVNNAGYNPATSTITVDAAPEPSQPTGTNFTVSDLDPQNVTVDNGTAIDVSATITNDGNASGSQTVEFRVDGNALATSPETIDAGNSTTVEFTNIDTAALGPGTYTHGVFTENDSQTATLTVEEDAGDGDFANEDFNQEQFDAVFGADGDQTQDELSSAINTWFNSDDNTVGDVTISQDELSSLINYWFSEL